MKQQKGRRRINFGLIINVKRKEINVKNSFKRKSSNPLGPIRQKAEGKV